MSGQNISCSEVHWGSYCILHSILSTSRYYSVSLKRKGTSKLRDPWSLWDFTISLTAWTLVHTWDSFKGTRIVQVWYDVTRKKSWSLKDANLSEEISTRLTCTWDWISPVRKCCVHLSQVNETGCVRFIFKSCVEITGETWGTCEKPVAMEGLRKAKVYLNSIIQSSYGLQLWCQ